jgi:capsular exopolysaccharide synthesis family protein
MQRVPELYSGGVPVNGGTSLSRGGGVQYVPVLPFNEPVPPSDWHSYLIAIARRKWFVLLVTLVGTGAGVFASRLLGSKYTAKSVLWIESGNAEERRQPPEFAQAQQGVIEPEGFVELLTSHAVLDSVVRELGLFVRPRVPSDRPLFHVIRVDERVRAGPYKLTVNGATFTLTQEDDVVERGAVGDSVGRGAGFAWLPLWENLKHSDPVEFTMQTPYEAARELASALKVRLDPSGEFLTLQLSGSNPALTAATLNSLSRRAVRVAADLKRQKFEELERILREQYDNAEGKLRSAESALRDFRVKAADVLPGGLFGAREAGGSADPAITGALQLQVEREQLRRDRQALSRALAGGTRLEALAVIGSVQHSPELTAAIQEASAKQAELRAARYRYTAESEPVRRLTAELDTLQRRTIPALARTLQNELAARDQVLAPDVASAVRRVRALPPVALDAVRLERDVAGAEETFNRIRQQYESARLSLVSTLPDLRVLDAARAPRRPSGSLAPLLVFLSFVTSFGLAAFAVVVMDRVDPKVRYPEQVTRGMRLTILGAVPHASWRAKRSGEGANQIVEALRGLRLRVLHAYGVDGPLMLTITSPGIGEGKSFVSANLALAFADAGYRTLLIDGDTRRGGQHNLFDVPRLPGLTDVLAGRAPVERALQPTKLSGLTLLPCGTRMHRGPELLLSPLMRELMQKLRTTYSIIIVDSPPLAAGADPIVLSTVTGNMMLVLRAGTTDLALAEAHLDALDTLPVRILGAVLNDVRSGPAYRYHTYYLSAPEREEDERTLVEAPPRVVGMEP